MPSQAQPCAWIAVCACARAATGSFLLLAVLTAAACSPAREEAVTARDADEASVTEWTAKTELFVNYPALIVGEVSRLTIHLTRLDTFKAPTEGRVEVVLTGGGAPSERFALDTPSRPGVFAVDVRPAHAATRDVAIAVRLPGLDDAHFLAGVRVHPDRASARAAATEPARGGGEGITFPKQQQWTFDFATAVVGQASLRESLRAEPVRPAVPLSAIVDDAGQPVVYVQTGGETFVRRPVTLGPRSGEFVQVIDGIASGERVVTRGAHLVRLASHSTSAPAQTDVR